MARAKWLAANSSSSRAASTSPVPSNSVAKWSRFRGGVGLWAPVWPVWPRLLGGSLLSPPAIGVMQRYAQSQSPSGIVISGTEAPKEPSTAVLLQVSLAGSCERHPLAVFVENQDVDVASRRLSASCRRADEHDGRCRVQTGTKQCLQSRFGDGNARAGDGWQPGFRCVGVTRSHARALRSRSKPSQPRFVQMRCAVGRAPSHGV